ncbi:MAG: hypothetical protein AAGD25_04300 [Cyanobacteria bacterium P01_F01_bin.150]
MISNNASDDSKASSFQSSDSVTIEGVVRRSRFGAGAWTIESTGRTVQIFRNQPEAILEEGLKVRVTGKVRTDMMTAAMVGPVFEVDRYQRLE